MCNALVNSSAGVENIDLRIDVSVIWLSVLNGRFRDLTLNFFGKKKSRSMSTMDQWMCRVWGVSGSNWPRGGMNMGTAPNTGTHAG